MVDMKVFNPYKLEDWGVVAIDLNPYLPLELMIPSLFGKVYGHPKFAEGEDIVTSEILESYPNRLVKTHNSWYKLGKPSEAYAKFLEENGHVLDEDEPVKVHRPEQV